MACIRVTKGSGLAVPSENLTPPLLFMYKIITILPSSQEYFQGAITEKPGYTTG
jgi:hypothetical protein